MRPSGEPRAWRELEVTPLDSQAARSRVPGLALATACRPCAPRPGQVQAGVQQRPEQTAGDADMDGDDAVGDLADATQVLPLHARGLVALLEAAGLVDDADGAQRVGGEVGQHVRQLALEQVPGAAVIPGRGGEELLEGADGVAAGQGNGLDALARQVGEQAAAVAVEVGGGRALEEAGAEAAQELTRLRLRPTR